MPEADDCCSICYKPFTEGAEDKIFCPNCRDYFCQRCFGEIEAGRCKYCTAAKEAFEEVGDELDDSCLIF